MKLIVKNLKIFFLCPLFILLGSIITLSVVQVDNHCFEEKINEENKRYYRTANFKNPNLIILIISAPTNLDRRNIARETWLALRDNKKSNILHYFVVGSLDISTDLMLHLSAEQSMYNDLLILPIKDSYFDLTNKILQSFVWINEQISYGLNFSFILKCDDDSFVRTDLIKDEIESLQARHAKINYASIDKDVQSINIQKNNVKKKFHVYWGYFKGNAKIQTQGKWKQTNWILCNNYIPYAQGGGYIISQSLVTYLAKNSEDLSLYISEDASLGTWLAPVSNIVRIHDTRFDTEWTSRGCQNSHLIFHKISTISMKKMYKNILDEGKPCIEENIKRKKYLYDWTSQPSQCCNRI